MLNSAYSDEYNQLVHYSLQLMNFSGVDVRNAVIALIKADYTQNPSKFAWIIKYNSQSLSQAYSTQPGLGGYPIGPYDPYLITLYIGAYVSKGNVSQDTATNDMMNFLSYLENLYTVMQSYMAQNNISASQIASSSTYQNAVLTAISAPVVAPTGTGTTTTTPTTVTVPSVLTDSTVVSGVPNYLLFGGIAFVGYLAFRRRKSNG